LDGVLVVDKPAGPTSHDVIDRVRRTLHVKKAGHTGTLDPFATGALPVCLGKATRLVPFLSGGDKVYRATVRLGFATTTDDLHGSVIGVALSGEVDAASIEAACRELTGAILQVPPAFSAKHVAGRRAHQLARRGEAVELAAVPVTVRSIAIAAHAGDQVELEIACSPGTYVRALARDLGQKLGTGGHLVALRRLRTGAFDLEGSVTWDEIESAGPKVRPLEALLPDHPAVTLGAAGRDALGHGRDLTPDLVVGFPSADVGPVRLLDASSGALLGIGRCLGFSEALPGVPGTPALHPDIVFIG